MDEESNQKFEKEKRIKKEVRKIKKYYENISKEKKERISDLIYRASFLLVLSQDMEESLKSCDSFTSTTVNASQTFIKSNPLLKEYRDTVKSYQAVMKQLNDLTKDDLVSEPVKDDLDDFLNS